MSDFETCFEQLTGNSPFPWQAALYEQFLRNEIPGSCQLPTGLGKTSVIPIWLIALAMQPRVPRRLVYVVNRRTVVDQTTTEVETIRRRLIEGHCPEVFERLRAHCAFETEIPLGISTLRGQFADNQEWVADPARPAVICGTVDMIGSRLLFSGYRIGFKSRPLHAGFLGQDSLIVHDEAHLEPAFQSLLLSLQKEQRDGRFPDIRPSRVMELSATSKGSLTPFRLTDVDHQHEMIQKRVNAHKQLVLHSVEDEKKQLPGELVRLALDHQDSGESILIFARSVEVVEQVSQAIQKKFPKETRVVTLTGTMRGLERDELATKNGVFARFLSPSSRPAGVDRVDGTVFLVCTSAGEVGVNLSAHHLVCDLSTFDSMAQRFGRVNRFGEWDDTRIDVVHPELSADGDKLGAVDERRERTLRLLQALYGDASPRAIQELNEEDRLAAFAPCPKELPVSDILFDAWTLTTIADNLPGRPPVNEYLHGLAEWERPRTQIAWREEVEILADRGNDPHGPTLLERLALSPEELLDDYPVKPHELLQDESGRIFDKLKKIAARWSGPVWVTETDRDGLTRATTLAELINVRKDEFSPELVILPPQAGGLDNGLLSATSADASDVSDQWWTGSDQAVQRRLRLWDQKDSPPGMRLIRTIDIRQDAEFEDSGEELPEASNAATKRQVWRWFVRPASADDDSSKTSQCVVSWEQHTDDVGERIAAIGRTLFPGQDEVQEALSIAAYFHDMGKRRVLWQRSIGNPNPSRWFAKSGVDPETGTRWQPNETSRYRHEFGSLMDLSFPTEAEDTESQSFQKRFHALSSEMQDVVLHLIATHHGRGRPHFPEQEAFDPIRGQIAADEIAAEIPRRFTRLQRRYGRWGLAWLESLLRAADISASRNPGGEISKSTTEEV